MQTLLLDVLVWDLVVDASGNIALASEPYALAQDAASMIQTYQGELYYDTTVGVPYYQSIFGKAPSVPLLKAQLAAAALQVPDTTGANVFISSFSQREIQGQVQIVDIDSPVTAAASFTAVNFQGIG